VKRSSPVRILLCAAALAVGAAFASAQDAPAGAEAEKAERLLKARERWEKMSPEERDRMLRRFEKWNQLPADQREDLRRRFDEIGGREGAAVVRRRMEDLRHASPEQIQRMRIQAAGLGRLWDRFTGTLPPRVAERWAALPPEAKARMRNRFSQSLVAVGKEAVDRKYATEAEYAAIKGSDPDARRAAKAAMRARRREAVLLPRKDELEKLPPEERRVREARLFEEDFWACARERLKEKFPQVRAAVEKAMADRAERRNGAPKPGPDSKPGDMKPGDPKPGKEWFAREFGVSLEELGVRGFARPLMLVLHSYSPESRPAFLAEVRPELRRIAALPLAEREAALKALLEKIR
jgi:hypothetical protein